MRHDARVYASRDDRGREGFNFLALRYDPRPFNWRLFFIPRSF